jgi:hypothetical protein
LDLGDGVDTVVFEIVHVTSGRDAFWLDAAGLDPGIPLGLNERVGRSYAPMMKALKHALLLAPSVMRELGMIAEVGRVGEPETEAEEKKWGGGRGVGRTGVRGHGRGVTRWIWSRPGKGWIEKGMRGVRPGFKPFPSPPYPFSS